MSEEKTKITTLSHAPDFQDMTLPYQERKTLSKRITAQQNDAIAVLLLVPREKWVGKCLNTRQRK
jgi:hypothetical protein